VTHQRIIKVALACLAFPGLVPVARIWIHATARRHLWRTANQVPPREVAIVPGCLPLPDGSPSPMLADRLAAGLELYRRGLVERLLVSGNSRHPRGDEAAAMDRWLLERDVPPSALTVDGEALYTRDTMVRAAGVYGVRTAVICTQRFHLARAVYLARRAGLDAVGLEADRRHYQTGPWEPLRELAAQTAAFVDENLPG
jgi:SanA protein